MRRPVITLVELHQAKIERALDYNEGVLLLLNENRFCYFRAAGYDDPEVFLETLDWCDFSAPGEFLTDLHRAMAEVDQAEE